MGMQVVALLVGRLSKPRVATVLEQLVEILCACLFESHHVVLSGSCSLQGKSTILRICHVRTGITNYSILAAC